MKRYEAVIANSRVDRHGESISEESLRELANSIGDAYLPVGIEHDPREPPIGRVDSAYLRELPDGEHEVVAVFELFEGDVPAVYDSQREIRLRTITNDQVQISYDRNYDNKIDKVCLRS